MNIITKLFGLLIIGLLISLAYASGVGAAESKDLRASSWATFADDFRLEREECVPTINIIKQLNAATLLKINKKNQIMGNQTINMTIQKTNNTNFNKNNLSETSITKFVYENQFLKNGSRTINQITKLNKATLLKINEENKDRGAVIGNQMVGNRTNLQIKSDTVITKILKNATTEDATSTTCT